LRIWIWKKEEGIQRAEAPTAAVWCATSNTTSIIQVATAAVAASLILRLLIQSKRRSLQQLLSRHEAIAIVKGLDQRLQDSTE
jgi:hypothetical protein